MIKVSEKKSKKYAESIVNTIREPLVVLDEGLRVISASSSYYKTFIVTQEVLHRHFSSVYSLKI